MLKAFARISARQAKNLAKLVLGRPLAYSGFASTTLNKDDVIIARHWLSNRSDWNKPDVVRRYEQAFARWNGSKYAFAFMGGRVALSACIYALNLQPGDEVILPGYTCVVVPNAFHFSGVKTIYSDIELDTYGLDISFLEDKITLKTRAIFLHHLYGIVCRDYEQIIEVAKKHGLYVIEDCAQSTGAEFKGRKIGNYGDIAIYSTENSKVFTTIQGGLAVTNQDPLANRLRDYYNYAGYPSDPMITKQLYNLIINYYSYKDPQRWWKGDFLNLLYPKNIITSTTKEEEQGIKPSYYGKKMPAPIAAIGLNQLIKVDRYNEIRRQTSRKWDNWCENNGYKKPFSIPGATNIYLRYPVMVEPQLKIDTSWAQKELGVYLGVWFVSNIHPVNRRVDGCPNADKAVKQCINFPGLP